MPDRKHSGSGKNRKHEGSGIHLGLLRRKTRVKSFGLRPKEGEKNVNAGSKAFRIREEPKALGIRDSLGVVADEDTRSEFRVELFVATR
jgi:hypothetical protein